MWNSFVYSFGLLSLSAPKQASSPICSWTNMLEIPQWYYILCGCPDFSEPISMKFPVERVRD